MTASALDDVPGLGEVRRKAFSGPSAPSANFALPALEGSSLGAGNR